MPDESPNTRANGHRPARGSVRNGTVCSHCWHRWGDPHDHTRCRDRWQDIDDKWWVCMCSCIGEAGNVPERSVDHG